MDDGSSPYNFRCIIVMGINGMTTLSIRPIFYKKSEYADLEYLPEEIYEAIVRYVDSASKFGSLDMQDIMEGEFEITIDWRRK